MAIALAGQPADVCMERASQEARLLCVVRLNESERDRADLLLDQVIQRSASVGAPGTDSLADELRETQNDWTVYAEGACGLAARRAGSKESFEGYYAFFTCLRRMALERSRFFWREYGLEGAEPEPLTPVRAPESD